MKYSTQDLESKTDEQMTKIMLEYAEALDAFDNARIAKDNLKTVEKYIISKMTENQMMTIKIGQYDLLKSKYFNSIILKIMNY